MAVVGVAVPPDDVSADHTALFLADDPQQPLTLVIVDLTYAHSLSHEISMTCSRRRDRHPDDASQQGKRGLLRQ